MSNFYVFKVYRCFQFIMWVEVQFLVLFVGFKVEVLIKFFKILERMLVIQKLGRKGMVGSKVDMYGIL